MKKKIWEMVVQKYKDETSIKEFIIDSVSNIVCIIIGIIIAFIIKIVVF